MAWSEYFAAFASFFITHSVPLRPFIRSRIEATLGRSGFTIGYSALSLIVLGWLIAAAGRAPYVVLWERATWQDWVPLLTMPLVCLIIALSVGRPNPFSFGGARSKRFDPLQPGLVRWTRHPLLLALALWAGAHMVPNGDLAHIMLFGSFAGFAFLGMWIIDRRKRVQMGDTKWLELIDRVRNGPVLPHPISWTGAAARLISAALLYITLIAVHQFLFGVSPLN